jgi:endonuclease/exonuclease/phosphatase family metal-dependent hydrolase
VVARLGCDDARRGAGDVHRGEQPDEDERTPDHQVFAPEAGPQLPERQVLGRGSARGRFGGPTAEAEQSRREADRRHPTRPQGPDARPVGDERLQRIERLVRGEIGGERLVQADKERPCDPACRCGERHRNTAQRQRPAIQKDEFGEVCVALRLHRGIVGSLPMPRTSRPSARTMRVATYNILLGGERRRELVHDVLARIDADVVALQEVREVDPIRDIARDLGMELLVGAPSDPDSLMHTAILTRLPVRAWRNRRHHGRMLRSHLHCEVETGGTDLPTLGVHCVHLAARFGERNKGEARRIREIGAVLTDIAHETALPHMLIGDFNALAPSDDILATAFFRRMNDLRRAGLLVVASNGTLAPLELEDEGGVSEVADRWRRAGVDPRLIGGIPVLPRLVSPLTAGIPVSRAMDRLLGRFIERWTVERLLKEGYVDCYRQVHPRARGLTCATWQLAARVDYVFATRDLAEHVVNADVVGGRTWPDADAAAASDHYPVVAEFSV